MLCGMTSYDPSRYGSILAALIPADAVMPLDAGHPNSAAFEQLRQLTVENAFQHAQVADAAMARCCLSAVWLRHNYLEESHTISQGISTPSGSYWHGIMHRREGDFSNAKYWMRRVGEHPIDPRLAETVGQLEGSTLPADATWDAAAFIDACASALRGAGKAEIATLGEIQLIEWKLLFEHCYSAAVRA
jgi:hypothetical protein